jgi:hypothetical protein
MSYATKLLTCIECKKNFVFSIAEQEERASRGYPNEPERCRPCRQARNTRNRHDNDLRAAHHSDSYFR